MLTMKDALELPVFAQANLVAGEGGLANQIRWVHIVDVPDATYEWSKGGELLLTAGFGLREDPERRRTLIAKLAAKGMAGMVVSVGHYLDRVPEEMRLAGDQHNFPIIELPPEVPFIEITETIFSQIVHKQYDLLQRTEDIHRSLTALVLGGANLQDVAEALGGVLGRSITVENASYQVLATVENGQVDQARTRSVNAGRTPADLAHELEARGIYQRLAEGGRPLRLPAMTELGMSLERIAAPIVVAGQVMGYVWIISGDKPLDDLDELAIEHAATVAALIMLKEQAVHAAEMSRRGALIEQLLSAPGQLSPALVERAHQLGFHLDRSYQVLLLERPKDLQSRTHIALLKRVEEWLAAESIPALVSQQEARVMVILQGRRPPEGVSLAERLLAALNEPEKRIRIGAGRAAAEVNQLAESYNQARAALEIASLIEFPGAVVPYEDLGVYAWLHQLPEQAFTGNRYLGAIRRLDEYDAEHKTDLLNTLEAFLDAGGGINEAAERLFVHRNTLQYRLERIAAIVQIDPKDTGTRLNLHVAVKGYRFFKAK